MSTNYQDFLPLARIIVAAHKAQYHGIYTMFGGGGPSGNTTSTNVTTPWSQQQKFLSGASNPNLSGSASPTGVFQSAAQLYNNPSDYPQMFPGSNNGSQTAGFTPLQNQALTDIGNTGLDSPLMNSASNAQQYILNGGMLSKGNPYQQAELDNVNAQITPQIEAQFTQGNSMNNPAAAFATAQGIGSADANILGENYNNAQNQLTQTSMYAPMTFQQQMQGEQGAANAGATQQTQNQNVLNGEINAWNYNQQLPYQQLQNYAGLVNGNYGGTTTSTQPYYSNNTQNMISDGLSAAAVAAMFMSDRRLKKHIKRISTLISGLPVYVFEYLWGGKHIGCMADEVEKFMPEAIGDLMGFKTVNYSMVM